MIDLLFNVGEQLLDFWWIRNPFACFTSSISNKNSKSSAFCPVRRYILVISVLDRKGRLGSETMTVVLSSLSAFRLLPSFLHSRPQSSSPYSFLGD